MKLPHAEEQIMKHLWKLKKAYMKDIINEYPDPKPAKTTVATLLRRMIDKGVIGYNQYSKMRQYYPLIKKKDYFAALFSGLIKNFFNGSVSQFASCFATETDLSEEELEELRDIVNKQIDNKKN